MGLELFQIGRYRLQCLPKQFQQFLIEPGAPGIGPLGHQHPLQLLARDVQAGLHDLPGGAGGGIEELDRQNRGSQGAFHRFARGRGVKFRHGLAFALRQLQVGRQAAAVRGQFLIHLQEEPVKFRFDLHMGHPQLPGLFHNEGMEPGIQHIVTQHAVHAGRRALAALHADTAADPGEEGSARLFVVFDPQAAGAPADAGPMVEKQIRPVETHVIQPPEPLDTAADIRRQCGKNRGAETVVGVMRRHGTSPFHSSKDTIPNS